MITVATAEEMHQLGLQLSAHLCAGDLILINGPLGAGKTVLAHVDAYRLLDTANPSLYLDDLDLDIENSITVIEWGGAESARLSEDRLEIGIDRSDEIRRVEITCIGKRWAGFTL
jgi:tRNA threonylcarbamoyladenosine biosynthesis protein TsaE